MRKINWPIATLIFANLIWGAGSPIMKFTLLNIPPYALAFFRFLIASLVFYPFVHKQINYPDLKNKWLWVYSLAGVTFNIIFFFWALEKTASINAPVIGSAGPILVLIGSLIFLREKVKLVAIIGTVISLIGVFAIIFEPLITTGLSGEILGNFYLVLATFFAVVSTIAGRKFLTPQNALGTTFWSCLIGTISFLPLMIWELGNNPYWISKINYSTILGIFYGGLFSSALAYWWYNWALSKLPAYRVSIFAYLDPIVAIIIAIPLLGEKITLPFVIGSVLILLGILISERRLHWHPLHKLFNQTNHPISNLQ